MITSERAARQDLAARLRGTVTGPDDPGYDAGRAAWNLVVDQHPAVIVRATDADDVAAAVRWAAGREFGVAIQATGHGVARPADDTLLLITGDMGEVQVDTAAGTARIEAGAKWEAVLGKASPEGLAPLLGSSPDVGAVGYTLGGGLGWLARKHGLAADSVRCFEVVTGDGTRVRASAAENPDLFWGLRGGGAGSLGVVTAMEIDLFRVNQVYGGNLFYPASDAAAVAARYAEWIADAPDDLTSSLVLMNLPPLEIVPEPLRGRSFSIVRGCHVGTTEDAEAQLAFWREWKQPEFDLFGPMPFSAVATISNDPLDPTPAISSTDWLQRLDGEVIDALIAHAFPIGSPPPLTFVEVRHVGGAVARGGRQAAAYGNRDATLLLEAIGISPNADVAAAVAQQAASLRAAVAPHCTGGAYLNFLEGEERARRTREGFAPGDYRRLQELKRRWDPQNLFRYGIDLTGD